MSAVYREGHLNVPRHDPLPLPRVLFDTGALHGSYISHSFVHSHREILSSHLLPTNSSVTLADNHTEVHIDHIISLPMSFRDDSGSSHSATITLHVFPMVHNTVIIGLPDILFHFGQFFVSMLSHSIDNVPKSPSVRLLKRPTLSAVSDSSPAPPTIPSHQLPTIDPWSTLLAHAPEDLLTPLPVNFSEALHFMEMGYEDSVKEYFSQFGKQVHPDFAASTDVLNLLETKGLQVFVPQNWEGIDAPPLELQWTNGLPASLKPRARSINPRLFENAKAEFTRLRQYFYEPSDSAIASCLVIAPKATKPFIRFCGDYVAVNKYVVIPQTPIPNVQHELDKLLNFKVFVDLDWTNSFHQFRLAPRTSDLLSVQTPWGLFRPKFMPEGVGPASGILQNAARELFADFEEWTISIFDNLLVMAHDYADAYRKLELVLDRCIERNVFLKFTKSWLGFDHAKFFGYLCRHGSYELDDERKLSITSIPFPNTLKKMQRFLGAALFFRSFVPHFSTLTAPLHDMTRQEFDWRHPDRWPQDYNKVFVDLKSALISAHKVYLPNFELDWILRTDASLLGVGAVLFQLAFSPDSPDPVYQPIAFISHKFSPAASRWTTIEQEAFGIYFAVDKLSFHLRNKEFVLETDHNNLLWIEASVVPKIMRWRIFLQSFTFRIRHIPGRLNLLADYLSRMYDDSDNQPAAVNALALTRPDYFTPVPNGSVPSAPPASQLDMNTSKISKSVRWADPPVTPPSSSLADTVSLDLPLVPSHAASTTLTADDLLRQVHGGRAGHHGARRTYNLLQEHFPGHHIPYAVVSEFVASCPVCQKSRLSMTQTMPAMVRHLKPLHLRAMIGIDTLTVTPPDKRGNKYIIVIVVLDSKLCFLYPTPTHDAKAVADALCVFFSTYGMFTTIITDPGSEFMNNVVRQLTAYFGVVHNFSLVDRHESNGVESHNRLILDHLRALVMDERIRDDWSSPSVLSLVQFFLNSFASSETGIPPFHAHFGSQDAIYSRMPESADPSQRSTEYLRLLDDNVQTLRSLSHKFQADLLATRLRSNPSSDAFRNLYQPGDFVLFHRSPTQHLPDKLTPKYLGPYKVVSQTKNDVSCRSLIDGSVHVFHVTRLKLFFGTYDDAFRMAQLDADQHLVRRLLGYQGNPEKRRDMQFLVEFADDSVHWLPWSRDISDTIQFEEFCRAHAPLSILLLSAAKAAAHVSALARSEITLVSPGDSVLVDIRAFGSNWYAQLDLPGLHTTTYLLEMVYGPWVTPRHRQISVHSPLWDERYNVDNDFVTRYGSFRPSVSYAPLPSEVRIDATFCIDHPQVLPASSRQLILSRLRAPTPSEQDEVRS